MVTISAAWTACNSNENGSDKHWVTFRGVYNAGPEVKSFKDCDLGTEYWAADSSAQLELQYSKLNFGKPYVPVYVELQGFKVKSGREGKGGQLDSTLVVKKVMKITKEIPADMCN